jgi:hypothetical protein
MSEVNEVEMTDEQKPRLRAAIAEYIYKWRKVKTPDYDYDGPCESTDVLVSPDMSDTDFYRALPFRGTVPLWYFCKKWESDMVAAWQVVKHLGAQGYSWQANQEPGQDCYFEFSKRLEPNEFGLGKWQSGRARETDVALAVCLAAYMAMKGEGWK